MRPSVALLPLVLAPLGFPLSAVAQGEPTPSLDTFVQEVREATRRYQDPATAFGDGYRRMGPDVPSMGQHWIALDRVTEGATDPRRPPILEYATIGGQTRLIGVGYARVLAQGIALDEPVFPAPESAWRMHLGPITEEGLLLTQADDPQVAPMTEPRLAILHAWVWQSNPDGMFAADNWSLPYIRLGLAVPTAVRPSPATLALALACGGETYFHSVLRLRYEPRPSEALRTAGVLGRYARAIRATVQGTTADTAQLSAQWQALDEELRAVCPTCSQVDHPLLRLQPGTAPIP